MKKKTVLSRSTKFIVSLILIFATLIGVAFGGYLLIDRVIIPKYLSSYGIYNLDDLVSVVDTMYKNPDESSFIKNPYTDSDKVSAFNTLKDANFPVVDTGLQIDYNKIALGDFIVKLPENKNFLEFTDKEMASLLDDMLKSGVLASNLKEIKSLDTVSMNVKQIQVTPTNVDANHTSQSASICLIMMLDTSNVRVDMAKKMDVPLFLLNMIIPKQLYLTCDFDVEKIDGVFNYSNLSLAINGTTKERSKILINLMISFIFEDEEQMTAEKLTIRLGSSIEFGLDLIGEFEFASNLGANANQNGIKVYLK